MDSDAYQKKILKGYGRRVRELRKEQGYSQEAFAFECDLHRTYIGAIERGEQNVSLKNIAKIALILKKPIIDFFEK